MMTTNSLPEPEWGHCDTGKAADNGVCYINYTRTQLIKFLNGDKAPLGGGSEGDKRERASAKEHRKTILELLRKGPVPSKKLKKKYGSTRILNVMQGLRERGCIIECLPGTKANGCQDIGNCTYRLISDENYTEK